MKTIEIDIPENGKIYPLLIGRNKYENEELIKKSNQNDLWFHLEKISGPHFVLKTNGENIPKKYLSMIANLFSEYKTNLPKRYSVIFTEIKNIKLTNEIGTVIPYKTKKIRV